MVGTPTQDTTRGGWYVNIVGVKITVIVPPNNGYVEIFRKVGSSWVLTNVFQGFSDHQFFGYTLAMSGDGLTLAVGNPSFPVTDTDWVWDGYNPSATYTYNYDYNTASCVYLYRYDGTAWTTAPVSLKPANFVAGDHFGNAVSMSENGDTMVVGSRDDDNTTNDGGSFYIFN